MGRTTTFLCSVACLAGTTAVRTELRMQPSNSLDPLDLLSDVQPVDREVVPMAGMSEDNRRVEATINSAELSEHDAVREFEEIHALNCHKYANDPTFRLRIYNQERASRALHIGTVADDREFFDEAPPADMNSNQRAQAGAGRVFDLPVTSGDSTLETATTQADRDIHKCVLLTYTNRAIRTKQYKNPATGKNQLLDKPIFPQVLGTFKVDGIFHEEAALEKDQFFIALIEATGGTGSKAGLASCNMMGDPHAADRMETGQFLPKVVRKNWVIHGRTFEQLEEEAEQIAKHIKEEHNATDDELKQLVEHMKSGEKTIPFNHKLETAKVTFKKCQASPFKCGSQLVKYLHDAAFTTSSEQHPSFDFVALSDSALQVRNQRPIPASQLFNAQKGWIFPLGADYHAEIKGIIDWHTTLTSKRRCVPDMKQWLYVGVGMDNDRDIDMGVAFYQKTSSGERKRILMNFRNQPCIQGTSGSRCGKAWLNAAEYSGDDRTGAAEGDDEWMFFDLSMLKAFGVDMIAIMVHVYDGHRGAFDELEGGFARFVMGDASVKEDDMKDPSWTPEALQAVKWDASETVEYVDLDEIAKSKPNAAPAALIGMLYLEGMDKVVLPEQTEQNMQSSTEILHTRAGDRVMEYPGEDGVHYSLALTKELFDCGVGDCDIGDSICEVEERIFGLSRRQCQPAPEIARPAPKIHTASASQREESMTVVEAHELEQARGSSLDPLDLLAPESGTQQIPEAQLQAAEGAGGQRFVQALADDRAAQMSHDEWLQEMLVEFPGGIPGTDTLCIL